MAAVSKLIGNRLLSAAFLFLISFALFAPSLKNDFVWDDVEVLTKNNDSFTPSGIISCVIPKSPAKKKERYYRPVIYISMVIDKVIWGISSFGFHLSNIIFNSFSVVLLYFMALLIMKEFNTAVREGAAFLSALIFALHPMHVESVSWVAGRTDVLCAMFLFLAFISHILSYGSLWYLTLTGLSFVLSLFSKEVGIVFPILALVFDLMNRRLIKRANILKYAVYLLIPIVYLYLRGMAFVNIPHVAQHIANEGARQTISSSGHISYYLGLVKILLSSYFIYLAKLVFPFGFNAFITNVPRDVPYIISSVFLLSVLAVLSLLSIRKRENVTAFSILWILITLGPSALVAFFSISVTPLAERYLYIPSAGFCILIGYWIIAVGSGIRLKSIAWVAGGLLIAAYTFAAYGRQGVWRDDLSLWRDTTNKSPDHPLPHTNYGLALSNAGRLDEAVREFEIALSPEMNDSPRGRAITANNMGIVYLDKGEYPEAEAWFRKARDYDPGYGRTYYHLGLIYFIKGEITGSADSYIEAERDLKKSLDYYEHYGRAYLILAKVYMRMGEREKAVMQAKAAVRSGLPAELLKEAYDILEVDNSGGDKKPH